MKKTKIIFLFMMGVFVLIIAIFFSIAYGSKSIGLQNVIQAIMNTGEETFQTAVIHARIPRTIFGILAGSALAISGCLMQSITRNPIADPSILGVNTGASLFVVIGISFFSITTAHQYIWFAFIGAILTSLLVYTMAASGQSGATPMKLALSGAATATALSSFVNAIMLPNTNVMDSFRFWQIGSIGAARWETIFVILPYLLVGFLISMIFANHLNILALGDELANGLGLNIKRIRMLITFAGVLLCAATTALAGPIGFIGLTIPHFVRLVFPHDMRIVLPMSALAGSTLLLLSDVLGRIIASPMELEVGIVTAFIGAPVFIYIVRKAKVKGL